MTATGPSKEENYLGGYLFCLEHTHLETWLHLVKILSKIYGRLWGQSKRRAIYRMWRSVVGAMGWCMILQGWGRSWTSFYWGSAGRWSCRTPVSKASSVVYWCSNLHCSTCLWRNAKKNLSIIFCFTVHSWVVKQCVETQVRYKKGIYLLVQLAVYIFPVLFLQVFFLNKGDKCLNSISEIKIKCL